MQQFMVKAAPSLNPRTTKQFVSGLQKSLGQQVVTVRVFRRKLTLPKYCWLTIG